MNLMCFSLSRFGVRKPDSPMIIDPITKIYKLSSQPQKMSNEKASNLRKKTNRNNKLKQNQNNHQKRPNNLQNSSHEIQNKIKTLYKSQHNHKNFTKHHLTIRKTTSQSLTCILITKEPVQILTRVVFKEERYGNFK